MSLRVALIRQRYTPFGGAERFVERALTALTEQGAELTLITRQWSGTSPCAIHQCSPFFLGRRWRDASFAHCVQHYIEEQHFDLVQSHERIAGCDVYRAGDGVHRAWLDHRRRILPTWRSLAERISPYHRYVVRAEASLFSDARLKAIVCNSLLVKRELQHYYNVPEKMIRVIYSGVDTERFHPRLREQSRANIRQKLAITDDEVMYLFVGSGYERKGVATLLRALARLPQGHAVIVGKDKRQRRYEQLAAELGISERCHFLGAQGDVAAYYGAADVLVLPTLYDPFPNVVLESMASGLPVITTTTCGGADLIVRELNGDIVDALDDLGLSNAMQQMFNTDRRLAQGRAARVTVEPFTLQNMSQQLLSLYTELLGRPAT